jgi:hypothetical protein
VATHKSIYDLTNPHYQGRMDQNCVQLQDRHGTASSGIVRLEADSSVRGHGVVASYSLWMREVRGSTPRGPLLNYFFDRRRSPISSKYHFGQASRLSDRGSAKDRFGQIDRFSRNDAHFRNFKLVYLENVANDREPSLVVFAPLPPGFCVLGAPFYAQRALPLLNSYIITCCSSINYKIQNCFRTLGSSSLNGKTFSPFFFKTPRN